VSELFAKHLLPGLLLFTALYVSDYALTLRSARLYREGVSQTIAFEGSFELTPYYQKDIDGLVRWSPRFLAALVFGNAVLALVFWVASLPPYWRHPYPFVLGALVLQEFAVHLRHLRNIVLFRGILRSKAPLGRITYPRGLVLRASSAEILGFAALWLALFCLLPSPFLLGGATGCLALARRHQRLARTHEGAGVGVSAGAGSSPSPS
jgi:hypothetical protein